MITERAEVLVVGGGPAGASVAYFLARRGIDVIVVEKDKFPRDKTCGDGLNPRALNIMEEMGLEEEIKSPPFYKFTRYRISTSQGISLVSPLPKVEKWLNYGYVVPRLHLDNLFLEQARKAGARIYTGFKARELHPELDRNLRVVAEGEGEEGTFVSKVVVAADGSRATFTRQLGLSVDFTPLGVAIRGYFEGVEELDDTLNFFLDPKIILGYGWVFPTGANSANVGVGMGYKVLKKKGITLKELFDYFVQSHPLVKKMLAKAEIQGRLKAFPLQADIRKNQLRFDRVLMVGDAAKLIFPLSGEGVSYALESGKMAAETILGCYKNGDFDVYALSNYEKRVQKELGRDFRVAILLSGILAKPLGQNLLFGAASKDKQLALTLMGVFSNTVPPQKLFRPKTLLRIVRNTSLKNLRSLSETKRRGTSTTSS